MRSTEEVMERLKARHEENTAKKQKRTKAIVGAVVALLLIGISIPVYQKIGKGNKLQPDSGTTPTESTAPTKEVTPVITAQPTPSGSKAKSIETVSENGSGDELMPKAGVIYIGRSLESMFREYAGRDDVLFSVKITFQTEWDDPELEAFTKEYREKYERNPLYERYRIAFGQWFDGEYQEEAIARSKSGEDWVAVVKDSERIFQQVRRDSFTDEEWTELDEILRHVDNYDKDFQELSERIHAEELERLKAYSDLTFRYAAEKNTIRALISPKQFENFLISERFSYEFQWTEAKDLADLEKAIAGFTKVTKEVVTPEHTIVIDDSNKKLDKKLWGEHDADEWVWIYVCFGDAWEEGQRMLREQYPEEYAAYIWLKESEHPEPGDPRVELGVRGSELHNSLPGVWEEEQEAKYFARYPERLRYKTENQSVHSLSLRVPYSMVLEIVNDEGVTKIGRWPEDKRKPEVVGKYKGLDVYDLQGINEDTDAWYEVTYETE